MLTVNLRCDERFFAEGGIRFLSWERETTFPALPRTGDYIEFGDEWRVSRVEFYICGPAVQVVLETRDWDVGAKHVDAKFKETIQRRKGQGWVLVERIPAEG